MDTDKKLPKYYRLSEKYGVVKEWYDGCRFGNAEVYCPWDVICCCRKLRAEPYVRHRMQKA